MKRRYYPNEALHHIAALLRFGRNERGYGLAAASNRSRYASPYLRTRECYLSITHMRTELVTTLKRKATAIISEVDRERVPVLITQHGRPAASLVDVETYERLNQRLAILEGIARGERAREQRCIVSHVEAKKRLAQWLSGFGRSPR